MKNADWLYHYKALITAAYDGDTVTAEIDLGLKIAIKGEKLRLHRINAPEMRGDEKLAGKASRDYLRSRILGKEVILETIKDKQGKYGRYLAEIWLEEDGAIVNINDELVAKGFAEYHESQDQPIGLETFNEHDTSGLKPLVGYSEVILPGLLGA
jgi:micrococcal nuclease